MKIQNRLSFANVVSVLALIVAVAGTGGGVAYAHGKIGSGDLKKNAVKSKHVKNNNLKSKDIKNGNLKGKDVKNGSLGAQDLNAKTKSGLAEAGANVNFNGAVNSWFNRFGGQPTVNKTGTGSYTISYPGTSPTDDSVITVINSGGGSTLHCEAWDVNADGSIDVRCRDTSTDTETDTDFSMILFKS